MTTTHYLVGRGIADITGEPAECGMLGYGKAEQKSDGIHNRLRSRAFVFADPATDERVLLVVSDLPLMFDSVHREVLRRLAADHGELYTVRNVMLTVTHTHCGPGGYSDHVLYNTTTGGFHPQTFEAIVDGITEAIGYAHEDLAPATLTLTRGELHDASINRSPTAFARNPAEDRAEFPEAIDPQTTLLRIERDGRLVGAINWFATHGTSMSNHNTLISGDNKGYAGYHWERVVHGVDYLAGSQPEFIGAFAQTNAGDMSPNLNRAASSGPTDDEFENTRLIGLRQADAARALSAQPGTEVSGGLDARLSYVELSDVLVRGEFTPDGREHRTGPVIGGAAAMAGTDEGPGFPGFRQGRNPVFDALSRGVIYRLSPRIREAHAPKGLGLPGGLLNHLKPFVQERVPVQLLRIGPLYLLGIPGEVTIVAGLRMRRAVAAAVGADLADVLVAGYSNGYMHYVTTPEEYDEQRYEGGSTLFGRWEQPALTQIAVELAAAMHDGRAVPLGPEPPDLSGRRHARKPRPLDQPAAGHRFGDVVEQPQLSYPVGAQARAIFAGAHPNNDLHRGGTYLRVEVSDGDGWRTIADDGDWATKLRWAPAARSASLITISWDIPADAPEGTYRIRYDGDAYVPDGMVAISGATRAFDVTADMSPAPKRASRRRSRSTR